LVRQEVISPPTKDVKSVPRRFWYGEAEENSKDGWYQAKSHDPSPYMINCSVESAPVLRRMLRSHCTHNDQGYNVRRKYPTSLHTKDSSKHSGSLGFGCKPAFFTIS
jgi:hypothetical protein